ncbi:MAG: hypothetical protein ABSA72_02350 [Nitrososphaerales archaeon]|jgi:hypothetical protein
MERAIAEGSEGLAGRWWRSKGALAICAVIAAPMALLVLTGSLLIVPVVYAVIFVEGDIVIYLAIWRSQSADAGKAAGRDAGGPLVRHAFLSAGNVETLASYVKGAEKGSDFSRREMARTVAGFLRHSYLLSTSGGEGRTRGGDLREAFGDVITPYLNDPVVKAELGVVGVEGFSGVQLGAGGKSRIADRGRYLASLEAIVSKLEMDMEGLGSLRVVETPIGPAPPPTEDKP